MSNREEMQKIFDSLKDYGEKYNADYYCVILTPPEGKKVRFLGNLKHTHTLRGEYGIIIEGVVNKEVLFKPIKKRACA